jgi:hypothetical protein
VAGPALAEVAGGDPAVGLPLKRIGRIVGDKSLDSLPRRRQTGQREAQAASQRRLVGPLGRSERRPFQPREDEAVDWAGRPGATLNVWQRRINHRLKTPPLPPLVVLRRFRRGTGRFRRGRFVARIGRPHLDPADEVGNHLRRQLLLRRHFQRFVLDGCDQQAVLDLAGNDCRPALAPCAD